MKYLAIVLLQLSLCIPSIRAEEYVTELSYFKNVKVSDILPVCKKHKIKLYEENPPSKIEVSKDLVNYQKYFMNYYKVRNGQNTVRVRIGGLNNDLGVVEISIVNFKINRDEAQMRKIFNQVLNDFPKELFPKKITGPNWIESFSKSLKSRMKGLSSAVIDGIRYDFTDFGTEVSINISVEGN